jgi:hypothetical protein
MGALSKKAQQEQVNMRQLEKLNTREAEAKLLYGMWAHRVGCDAPWERIPVEHQEAWREIWKYVTDEPLCAGCGERLLCVDCDTREIRGELAVRAAIRKDKLPV